MSAIGTIRQRDGEIYRLTDITQAFDRAVQRARHPDAEAAVLGACINAPDVLGWLELDREAFFDIRHQHVWDAIERLRETKTAVDEATIASAMCTAGTLEVCGGLAFVAQLGLRCPTADNAAHYADILREHQLNRRILSIAGSVPSRFNPDISGEELLADVQRALADADTSRPTDAIGIGDAAERELAEIAEHARRLRETGDDLVGLPTGIGILDERLGGIPLGVPTVIAAQTRMGKSTLALNIAVNCAKRGVPVHVLTNEDQWRTYTQRVLSREAGVDRDAIRRRRLAPIELEQLRRATVALRPVNDLLTVENVSGLDAATICRRARACRAKKGTRLAIVDYLQLVRNDEKGLRSDERIERNINALATLATRDGMALIVISQFNRGIEHRKEDAKTGPVDAAPKLTDLRGSGAIEQAAKVVIALDRAKVEGEVVMWLLKHSEGQETRLVANWDHARYRIW